MSGDTARHLLAGDGLTACGVGAATLTPRTLTTFRSAVTCAPCRDGATDSPSAEMKHDPRCPAHDNPRWAGVGECGPCQSLAASDASQGPPEGPPEGCECGECYYVTPDCCGEPRPRCETGSAHDYYVCSRGMGCDAERDRDAEADALLARMLLNP